MSEWISVKDRLPEIKHIDSFGGYSDEVVIRYKDEGIDSFYRIERNYGDSEWHGLVTHWMPLDDPE